MPKQSRIIKYLIKELALKNAVTYTFTGFLALASHGRISGRFRASKNDQSVEIEITGNDQSPVSLVVAAVFAESYYHPTLLDTIQTDLDEASAQLDRLV